MDFDNLDDGRIAVPRDQLEALRHFTSQFVLSQAIVAQIAMSPRGRYYHLFRDDDVPRLRQVFAPEGTIDDLLVELTKTLLVCGGQRMEGFELFATGTISSLPLSRDGGHYRIYLRKKNNPDPAAAAAA